MCKIIAFTDTKKLNLKMHVNNIGNLLLKSEEDGFGYAVQGAKGVFGEKTIAKRFKSRLETNPIQLPVIKNVYSQFGEIAELIGPGVFHGRASTNIISLINTHPMQRDGWHLIHNGVVRDKGPAYANLTDNDSEDVLYRLIEGISSVEKHLEGYYAFAAIDPQGRLHIGRDAYATLFMAWSEVYETYIIATTEELILKVNKMITAKVGPIDEIDEDLYMIFEGKELIHVQVIKPLGFTKQQADLSKQSLGRDLGGGGEVIVRDAHHRHDAPMSEADWQTGADNWDQQIIKMENERLENEGDYYKYRHELDNMNEHYTILDENDNIIKLHAFYKMDYISQELCSIIRPDGTLVEKDYHLFQDEKLA